VKRLISIAGALTLAVAVLVLVQCEGLTGGKPLNPKVEADTDSTVKVSWTAPTEGTPDKYLVSFQEVGGSGFTQIYEGTSTSCLHDPDGATGTYKIEAKFGSTTYAADVNPSTVPINTAAATVAELNAAGNSGYGWDRTSGSGQTYSMTQASNAALVDFYFTDFETSPVVYSIASPDLGPTDPGNVVPAGSWRVNALTDPLTNETAPLPSHNPNAYFNYRDITQTPLLTGCYTEDGYYALVKLDGLNTGDKTIQATTWFQLVKGLRLIKH